MLSVQVRTITFLLDNDLILFWDRDSNKLRTAELRNAPKPGVGMGHLVSSCQPNTKLGNAHSNDHPEDWLFTQNLVKAFSTDANKLYSRGNVGFGSSINGYLTFPQWESQMDFGTIIKVILLV